MSEKTGGGEPRRWCSLHRLWSCPECESLLRFRQSEQWLAAAQRMDDRNNADENTPEGFYWRGHQQS